MRLIVEPDKKLFTAFLLINVLGYNYENNPQGRHQVRKLLTNKLRNCVKKDGSIDLLKTQIINAKLPKPEYIRLVNVVYTNKTDKFLKQYLAKKNTLLLFKRAVIKLSETKEIKQLHQLYIQETKRIKEYNYNTTKKYLESVLHFFNIPTNTPLNIRAHLNLLESYRRGSNYLSHKDNIISFSLKFNNKISWPSVRHEFMHILLKRALKNSKIQLSLPVNKLYTHDSKQVKFAENFIYASNIFFIKDKKNSTNNLKFYYDQGFKKIYLIYELLRFEFKKNKKQLNNQTIRKIIKTLTAYKNEKLINSKVQPETLKKQVHLSKNNTK